MNKNKQWIIIYKFLLKSILPGALLCIFSGLLRAQPKVGDVFPGWTEGYLDIHHINTGKGECAFFILPDGPTMLVDAGETQRAKPRVTDIKPNNSHTPGEWISRYIGHTMQGLPPKKLDYVLLTHFHEDHIGELHPEAKTSKSGAFKLTGITTVAENIAFGKLVDRGWPDYNWPQPIGDDYVENYVQFVKWTVNNKRLQAEQFRVGANKQFALVNNPGKYPNFEIRNIAANGHIWTGVGTNERNHFPDIEDLEVKEYPNENMCSIVFRLSYGKFDYYNGGDIIAGTPRQWQDIETPVALVTGPVDVCLANHHAYYDAMSFSFIRTLRPRVYIIQAWSPSHPSPSVLARMMSSWTYSGSRDVFATNVMEATKVVIGSLINNLKSQQGHIIIRVNPGGENYMIYILDDSAENLKIKSLHGPYQCN